MDISNSGQIRFARLTQSLSRNWILILSLVLGLYVGLPFLAPIFMKIGWRGLAGVIYFLYSWLCHQLPQRSYFIFGPKISYSLAEIQNAWQNTTNPLILRQFIGNSALGWKVAWSDRMVSMFTSIWLFGLLWRPMHQRLKPLPLWVLILFLLPMAVDGTSHLISDFAGIGQGFRDSNAWLATFTNHAFSAIFYAGDAWGSFNSLMRLVTGVLFGLGIVWFGYPYLDGILSPMRSPTAPISVAPCSQKLLRETADATHLKDSL